MERKRKSNMRPNVPNIKMRMRTNRGKNCSCKQANRTKERRRKIWKSQASNNNSNNNDDNENNFVFMVTQIFGQNTIFGCFCYLRILFIKSPIFDGNHCTNNVNLFLLKNDEVKQKNEQNPIVKQSEFFYFFALIVTSHTNTIEKSMEKTLKNDKINGKLTAAFEIWRKKKNTNTYFE